MTYHIEGRRWFQRTAGNTYHTTRIFCDGKEIARTPIQYGYGEQYLETALAKLADIGRITRTPTSYGGFKEQGTRYLREELGASHSVIDVGRERDL